MDLSILPGYRYVITELQSAWEKVRTLKELRVVLVQGESGMNKTDVVEYFLASSQAPCIVTHGSQIPEPYLPIRFAFEAVVRLQAVQEQLDKASEQVEPDWQIALTSLAQLLPILNLSTDPVYAPLAHWQPTALGRLITGGSLEADEPSSPVTLPGLFTLALGELSALLPIVFFVDNLDLADAATIESFTMDVLPALQGSPVLFVATFEPSERQPEDALSEFFTFVLDISHTQHLELPSLGENDVQTILQDQIPGLVTENISVLAHKIYHKTHGNLAWTREMVAWVKAMGDDLFSRPIDVPSQTELNQKRFDRLPKSEQAILQMAATQGTYFCSEAVARALGKSEKETRDTLDKLEQDLRVFGHFKPTTSLKEKILHWYHFRGRLAHVWAYQSISKDIVQQHQKMASALEHTYGEQAVVIAGLLAQQYEKAQINDKAAFYFVEVARQSNDRGAALQTRLYVQRGLDNLETLKDSPQTQTLRCDLFLQQGRALKGSEESHRAEGVLRQALDLAQQLQDSILEMHVLSHLGEALLALNEWDEGMEILSQVVEMAVEQKSWAIVVDAMENLRARYHRRAQTKHFFDLCDRYVSLISKDTSPDAQVAVAEILEDKGWCYYQRREHDGALTSFEQAFEHLRQIGSSERYPEIHYKLYRWIAAVLCLTGDYKQSLQEAENAIKWANLSRVRRNQVLARNTKADTLRQLGSIAEAEQEFETAFRLLRHSSDLVTLANLEEQYGFLLSNSGHKRRARQLYQQSYEHRLAANDTFRLQTSMNDLAAIGKCFGLFQSSLATYQRLLSEGLAQGDRHRQSISLNHLGDIYRMLNRIDKAIQSHLQVVQLCDEMLGRKALAWNYLGRAYLVSWNLEKAAKALLQSDSLYQKKATFATRHNRTLLFSARLALCQGKRLKAPIGLMNAIEASKKAQDKESLGIGYLNQCLVHLVMCEPEKALSTAQKALEALQSDEIWRVSETHHLLARCYLAVGDVENAQVEIEQAKVQFMDYGLFHRVYQAEDTEFHIQDARDSGDTAKWRVLSLEELRSDFNHLGI